ncbi:MAG: hypothetical protein ACI4UJ_05735 [Candidatus Cryptobacteroides sp.]
MKKRVITIDEVMSLPAEELDEMIRKDEEMLNDGVISESLLEIDFMGMTEDEIIRKYHNLLYICEKLGANALTN